MSNQNDTYHIGFSTIDITPPVGVYLAGFAARTDPSIGVYHPLLSTSIVIDDGSNPLVIVGAEILGFYSLTDATRRAISERIGIDPAHIILNGSHTHCGPSIWDVDRVWCDEPDKNYVAELIGKVADCTKQAWDSREPVRLEFGSGECGIAAARRKPDGKGGVEWKCDQTAPHDHQVPVIRATHGNGTLEGVLFSYACHPTSHGGLLIGGDYVGFALDRVKAANPETPICFLQGCAGDQKTIPVDIGDGTFTPREISEIEEIGFQLGDAVTNVLGSGSLSPISGSISFRQTFLDLETEPASDELLRDSLNDEDGFIRNWANHLLQAAENGDPVSTTVPFELQTVAFGRSLAVVTLSAEMTVEHGLRLKGDLSQHFDNVLVAAYSNNIIGYVPVKSQIPEGGYEVWRSNQYWNRTGPYVAETEDRIHQAIHQSLGIA